MLKYNQFYIKQNQISNVIALIKFLLVEEYIIEMDTNANKIK